MPEFLLQAALLGLVVNVVASALVGLAVTRRVGVPIWIGLFVGAILPWLGPAILALALHGRQRVWPKVPARSGFRLAGVIGLVIGAVFVVASSFVEWATGRVSALEYQAAASWGSGDAFLLTTTGAIALVFVALAVGSWSIGGLRFGLPAVFLAAQASAFSFLLVALAGVAPGLESQAQELSGGFVRLRLEAGRGAWLALLGCAVLLLGSVLLLAKPRGTLSPVVGREPALASPPQGSPATASPGVSGQPAEGNISGWGELTGGSNGW